MEEKNNVFKYLFIVFLILTCILGGFIVYDKFIKESDSNIQGSNNNYSDDNSEQDTNNSQDNNVNAFSENSYDNFKENFIKARENYYAEVKDKAYFVRNTLAISLDKDGNLYYSNENSKETIATNVLDFDFLYSGNGGEKVLYFIKEDGTVSCARGVVLTPTNNKLTFDKNNLDIKDNIGGYKNIIGFQDGIVSICNEICSDSTSPMFIDINGNMYNENIN